MRLDKYLADAGKGTRSTVKSYIAAGRVRVDGAVVKRPEYKVPEDAVVTLDDDALNAEAFQYFLLNKPAGVVSATRDAREKTVLDLLDCDKRRDLFPVGRLDKDTEGLLVITNDGKMSKDLLMPGKHVAKCYYVEAEGKLPDDAVRRFAEGLDIGDERPTAPAELSEGEKEGSWYLTVTEGRFHQVKRMFEHFGCHVTYLKRISMGGLSLPEDLKPGAYRKMTEEEIKLLTERG